MAGARINWNDMDNTGFLTIKGNPRYAFDDPSDNIVINLGKKRSKRRGKSSRRRKKK